MAVRAIGATYNKFQCTSTDEKPLDVADGATMHVIDTGEEFVFHNGMWELDLRSIRVLDGVLWI